MAAALVPEKKSPWNPFMLFTYNEQKAKQLQLTVQKYIRDQPEEEDEQLPKTPYISMMTIYSFRMPCFEHGAETKDSAMIEVMVDGYIHATMEQRRVINWCSDTTKLYPIKTTGDGNCLLHAAAVGMWGDQDRFLMLRQLLYVSMATDTGQLQERWRKSQTRQHAGLPGGGLMMQSQEWQNGWAEMVKFASDEQNPNTACLPYQSLEEIHIFVLAQILRRPIIVLAESVMRNMRGSVLAPNNALGIYLPLLWPSAKCTRTPLVLAYLLNHFCPLVSKGGNKDDVSAVPLLTYDNEPLLVHFMKDDEEKDVNTKLEEYLDLIEIPVTGHHQIQTLLAAKLTFCELPDNLNLMVDFQEKLEGCFQMLEGAIPKNKVPHGMTLPNWNPGGATGDQKISSSKISTRCITEGCEFYGSPQFGGHCSGCHKKMEEGKLDPRTSCEHVQEGEVDVPVLEFPADDVCLLQVCQNPASKKSRHRPYCDDHAYLKIASAAQPPPSDPMSLLDNPSKPVVPADFLQTVKHQCEEEGCELRAVAGYNGRCTQHYFLQQAKQMAEKVPVDIPGLPREKCKLCQHKNGLTHLDGLCGDCYTIVALGDGGVEQKAVKTEMNSEIKTEMISEAKLEMNSEVSTAGKTEMKTEAQREVKPDVTTKVNTEVQEVPEEELQQAVSTTPCQSKTCSSEGSEHTLGYCADCFGKLYRSSGSTMSIATGERSLTEKKKPLPSLQDDRTIEDSVKAETGCRELGEEQPAERPQHLRLADTSELSEFPVETELTSHTQQKLLMGSCDYEKDPERPKETSQSVSELLAKQAGSLPDSLSSSGTSDDISTPVDKSFVVIGMEGEKMDEHLVTETFCAGDLVPGCSEMKRESEEDTRTKQSSADRLTPQISNAFSSNPDVSMGHDSLSSASSATSAPVYRSCAGPSCDNKAEKKYNGLCEECYTILCEAKAKRGAYMKTSLQHQTCASGCGEAGNSEKQGYCSKCYRKQMSDPAFTMRQSQSQGSYIHVNMDGQGNVIIGHATSRIRVKKGSGSGMTTSSSSSGSGTAGSGKKGEAKK